jgi:hypothetical protein
MKSLSWMDVYSRMCGFVFGKASTLGLLTASLLELNACSSLQSVEKPARAKIVAEKIKDTIIIPSSSYLPRYVRTSICQESREGLSVLSPCMANYIVSAATPAVQAMSEEAP